MFTAHFLLNIYGLWNDFNKIKINPLNPWNDCFSEDFAEDMVIREKKIGVLHDWFLYWKNTSKTVHLWCTKVDGMSCLVLMYWHWCILWVIISLNLFLTNFLCKAWMRFISLFSQLGIHVFLEQDCVKSLSCFIT